MYTFIWGEALGQALSSQLVPQTNSYPSQPIPIDFNRLQAVNY